jgi:hypothetical protein
MTCAAWVFMGVIWASILTCIGISMNKIVKDNK